jgi:thioredoxin
MTPLNEKEYAETINTGKPLVLMVSASWCQPCRMLKPLLKKIEDSYTGKVKFYAIDSDESQELCGSLGISGIPTLIFIVGSKLAGRLVGVHSEEQIREHIEELLI